MELPEGTTADLKRRLRAAGLRYCVSDPERSSAEGYDLATVQKMFLKLA
jgi:hypothetical protein